MCDEGTEMFGPLPDCLLAFCVKSFSSSSFSVLRAKQKSEILFWNTINNWEEK